MNTELFMWGFEDGATGRPMQSLMRDYVQGYLAGTYSAVILPPETVKEITPDKIHAAFDYE